MSLSGVDTEEDSRPACQGASGSLRSTDRGQQAEDELNSLREAFDDLSSALDTLRQATESLSSPA